MTHRDFAVRYAMFHKLFSASTSITEENCILLSPNKSDYQLLETISFAMGSGFIMEL